MEVGSGGGRVQALGLVGDDGDLLAELAQRLRDEVIRWREPFAHIDEEQHAIGFLDGAQRLLRHQDFDAARVDDEAAGVDDQVRNLADFAVAVVAVARQPRQVRDQRVPRAGEEIEQRDCRLRRHRAA